MLPRNENDSELDQGVGLSGPTPNRKSNSASKANGELQKAENDPDFLPPEEDPQGVDPAHVDVDRVYSADKRVNTVNESSENNKESLKPVGEEPSAKVVAERRGITLEELDRKLREAGVDLTGPPLWRGTI